PRSARATALAAGGGGPVGGAAAYPAGGVHGGGARAGRPSGPTRGSGPEAEPVARVVQGPGRPPAGPPIDGAGCGGTVGGAVVGGRCGPPGRSGTTGGIDPASSPVRSGAGFVAADLSDLPGGMAFPGAVLALGPGLADGSNAGSGGGAFRQ